MTYQTSLCTRMIGTAQFTVPVLWLVIGILSKTSCDCTFPVISKALTPAIWCSVFPMAAGIMVITTNKKPTYQKLFWTMMTSWISTFFTILALAIEFCALYYLLVSYPANHCQSSYVFNSFSLLLGVIFLGLSLYTAVKFGMHYEQAKSARREQGAKREMAVSSDTGATLAKISALAIVLSIPAVIIAYGEPYEYTYLARVGAGIWCSVMCVVAGILCYKALPPESNSLTTATFAFGIIASFFATCELAIEVGAAVQCLMYQDQYPEMQTTFQIHMIIAACALYQLALSVFIAVTFGKMSDEMLSQIKYYMRNYREKLTEHRLPA